MDMLHSQKLTHAVTVQRSPEDLFTAWQNPREVSGILHHLSGRLRGDVEESEAFAVPHVEIVGLDPPRRIEWLARVGDEARCRGATEITPGPPDRGTEVRVAVEIDAESHLIKRALEKLRGHDPVLLLREDLRNFKQRMEAGEFPTTLGQPSGRRTFIGSRLLHAVQDRLQRAHEPAPRSATDGAP
ncbi:MAG TPA: hypothetical protein VKY73_05745 [Polyangiaceae bacterium]|nr:hypothetical protein [Polyangiaceae bacterium]